MVELAIATGTAPGAWESADDASIATALVILEEQYEAARRGR